MWPPRLRWRRRLLGRPARWSAVAAVVALVVSSGLAVPSTSRGTSGAVGFVRATMVDGRSGPVVGIARAAGTGGYWVVTANGRVSSVGGAAGLPSVRPNRWTGPVTAVAATPNGTGLVVVTAHGRIYTLGAGPDYPAVHPTWHEGLVAAVAVAPGGRGVWVVTTHGRVFTLGAAPHLASVHARWRTGSVTAAVATAGGRGLWLVTARGAILATGRAPRLPSALVTSASGPVTAAVAAPGRREVWLVTAHGHILTTGAAPRYPAVAVDRSTGPVTAATDPAGGLWMVTAAGMVVGRPAGASRPPSSATTTTVPATTTTDPPAAGPTVAVPASIPDNCSADATTALDTLFARLPTDATVVFPDHGCYLVSNTARSQLLLADTTGVTVEGNGSTLEQRTYAGGVCGTNAVQPVLQVEANTDLNVDNLVVDGPANCGGDTNEGDYGIMVGSWPVGNTGVTFTGVTIENTDGDGLAVYPQLATDQGVNTDITFQHGTLDNIGYHGVTLEGVDGFNFTGNTVEHVGNFMDLEVDNGGNCGQTRSTCVGPTGAPVGYGEVDVNIIGNTFEHGDASIESTQACVPVKDWTISHNTYISAAANYVLNAPCEGLVGFDTGLTISDNSSDAGSAASPWYGGGVKTPRSAAQIITGWTNVSVTGNVFTYDDAQPGSQRTATLARVTAGSNTVTSPNADFTSLDSGLHGFVAGPGIPPGDQIVSVPNPNQAILAKPAFASGSGLTVTIGDPSYYPNYLYTTALGLCSNQGTLMVDNNTFNNALAIWSDSMCGGATTPNPTSISSCGNTYGLTVPSPFYTGSTAPLTYNSAPRAQPSVDRACTAP